LAVALILVAIVIALIVWNRRDRDRLSPSRPARRTPSAPPATTPGVCRFKGNRIGAEPARKTGSIGRAVKPAARFTGEVTRQPNAVGLACGRPMSECKRGRDCLCV
jgi:hypothetical protein